jgi:hypothetical protein
MIDNHSHVWWWSNENMFQTPKEEWWLMTKLKILELCGIVFSTCKLSFFMEHFLSRVSNVWACTYCSMFHCCLHSFRVLHNKSCSSHYMCIIWKELIERICEPKKEKCTILLNILLMFFYFFFLVKFYFDMCFDNLIKFMHHIVTIQHKPHDINPFIPL